MSAAVVAVVVVDYTELQGSLIATCDSGVVSSHLDPNASSLHLKGKIEGWKQMSPLGVPGVGREKAAEGKAAKFGCECDRREQNSSPEIIYSNPLELKAPLTPRR